jgi:hypothetical protein
MCSNVEVPNPKSVHQLFYVISGDHSSDASEPSVNIELLIAKIKNKKYE